MKSINQGRLSKQQIRQMLLNHPNPSIRAKAQEAQRAKPQRKGSLDSSGLLASLSSLWALMNPFAATDAQAQSEFSVTLTPQAPISNYAHLSLHGANCNACTGGFCGYYLGNYSSSPIGHTINHAYARVFVSIPSTGWYLIDLYGNGKPSVTLRKQTSGGGYSVLESWSLPRSAAVHNHFATAEYLAQGTHAFYLTVDTSKLLFYEVSIEGF